MIKIKKEEGQSIFKVAIQNAPENILKKVMENNGPDSFEYIEASKILQEKISTEDYNNFIDSL